VNRSLVLAKVAVHHDAVVAVADAVGQNELVQLRALGGVVQGVDVVIGDD
jgi:hypothetical protein